MGNVYELLHCMDRTLENISWVVKNYADYLLPQARDGRFIAIVVLEARKNQSIKSNALLDGDQS